MSDPKYQYANQSNFTGGIATEPELRRVTKAGEVTVAEAADVWAPNGVLKRRPGVYNTVDHSLYLSGENPIASDLTGRVYFVADGSTTQVFAAGGAFPVTINTASQSGFLYVPIDLPSQPAVKYTGLAQLAGDIGGFDCRAVLWSPTGSPHLDGQRVDFYTDAFEADSGVGPSVVEITNGSLWFALYGGGSPTVSIGATDLFFRRPQVVWDFLGATYSKLPSGEKYLNVSAFPAFAAGTLSFRAYTSIGAQTGATYTNVATDPSLYNYLAGPPSWATVVDANRTYVAFSNQIYEYRPELATPFRLAQVNSEPLIVGPGGTYDSSIFAQYPRFPNANQVVYFNGLLFMTDIKGNPNVVQWGGPAIDGAVDVLPVLSYAILSDSRDNSPNVGFGVYNSNLYVFKQNSIWALIPAGQSEVDGSYLFTSRLVTSGAGCSAPGSIVSTPQGIIFYNQGGFYIFNGQKTEKLSSPIKKLFDAIVPGNAYQMQATHWPQQHSYVVTCKMSHPWPSDVFEGLPQTFDGTLGYDYQNNAWWIWLSVTSKTLYMDSYGNFITQAYFNEFRILDPNKEYDSDALAKSTAQPYIKTQRFGFGESLQKQYRELRVSGEIDNLNVETSLEINDQILAATDYDITFIPVDYDIVPLGTTIPDDDPYSPPWGRTEVPIAVANDGKWAQVRLNGGYGPFTIYNINLGYYVEGRDG